MIDIVAIRGLQREFKAEADEGSERENWEHMIAPSWKLYHAIDDLVDEIKWFRAENDDFKSRASHDVNLIVAMGKLRRTVGLQIEPIWKVIEAASDMLDVWQADKAKEVSDGRLLPVASEGFCGRS